MKKVVKEDFEYSTVEPEHIESRSTHSIHKGRKGRKGIILSKTFLTIASLVVLVLCSGVVGYYIAVRTGATTQKVIFRGDVNGQAQGNAKNIDFNKYWTLFNEVLAKYPGQVDAQKMFESSLKGLAAGVGDTPTEYFTADEYNKYTALTSGETFSGIGIEFDVEAEGAVRIINAYDGSPAQKAGLVPGDIITQVDGKTVSGLTNDELILKIKGSTGTHVKITVIRGADTKDFDITRANITVPAVVYKNLDNNISYIQIKRFTASTLQEWEKQWNTAVAQVQSANPKGIVIDLRSDGGGFVDASVYAASDFLDPGTTVVSEKAKDTIVDVIKSQNGQQRLNNYKVVILVDKYTASASEIFSGALRNYNKATIIGSDTYGKGTVQQIFKDELGDGSALKLTIANWVLPNGTIISKDSPIHPDIKIDFDIEGAKQGKDNVLDRGLQELLK